MGWFDSQVGANLVFVPDLNFGSGFRQSWILTPCIFSQPFVFFLAGLYFFLFWAILANCNFFFAPARPKIMVSSDAASATVHFGLIKVQQCTVIFGEIGGFCLPKWAKMEKKTP